MLKQRKIRWAELRSEVAADAKEAGGSLAKRLIMRVVENLQIKVKSVHIRFENTSQATQAGDRIETAGIMIDELGLTRVSETVSPMLEVLSVIY